MTTTTIQTGATNAQLWPILAAVLAPLILGAAVALAALTAPAPTPVPTPMTNQANSDDPTPLSGVLEFAD